MNGQLIIGPNNDNHVLSLSETKKKISFWIFKTAPTNFISLRTADVSPRSSPLGNSRDVPSGVERGETTVFAGYNFIRLNFFYVTSDPHWCNSRISLETNLFIHQPDLRNWDKTDFRSVKQIEWKLMEAQYQYPQLQTLTWKQRSMTR